MKRELCVSSGPRARWASKRVAARPRERQPGALASHRGSDCQQAHRRLPQPRQSRAADRSLTTPGRRRRGRLRKCRQAGRAAADRWVLLICAVRACQVLRAVGEVVEGWWCARGCPCLSRSATRVGYRCRRHDGDGVPAGGSCGAAARSLEAVHADVAAAECGELAAVHRLRWGVGAHGDELMRARAPGRRGL